MVMGLNLQFHIYTRYGQKEASAELSDIWSIVPVGSSHSDSVALPTLKDKEEKLMKLETLAFFHESMD